MVGREAPKTAIAAIHRRGYWPSVPDLVSLQSTPPIQPDGSVRWDEGYDPSTGAYYAPGGDVWRRDRMMLVDAQKGLASLRTLVGEFPWASPADCDAWIAGLLAPLTRLWSGPAPMTVVTSTVRSSGKSLLTDIAAIILGCAAGHIGWTSDEDELRKRLLAQAIAGYPLIQIDNVPTGYRLGSPSMDMALTSDRVADRVLGRSEIIDVPMRSCWWATGNNISLAEDTARRAILCRLTPTVERPEEREHTIKDLRGHVTRRRPELLSHAIVIVAGYLRSLRDGQPSPLGSFEGWSNTTRSALIWAGGEDPVQLLGSALDMADADADAHRRLLRAWLKAQSADGMTVSKASYRASPPDEVAELKAVFDELGISETPKMTRKLIKYEGRPREIDGRMLTIRRHKKDSAGSWLWRVEDI